MSRTNPPSGTFKTHLIALSGPSSSGKTTLARLLRSIFNIPPSPKNHNRSISLIILHEDDFYKTDVDIPLINTPADCPSGLGERELQDWDGIDSLNLPLFGKTMEFVRQEGTVPEGSVSKEDRNAVGPTGMEDEEGVVESLQQQARAWLSVLPLSLLAEGAELRVCVLDGFLLFPDPQATDSDTKRLREITDMMDLKLFLRCSRAQTIERRTKRTGYVTLEGFWEDPPGYVEDVVWVNYVRDHGWMLRHGESGEVDEEKARREEVVVVPGEGTWGMRQLLEWGTERLRRSLEGTEGKER